MLVQPHRRISSLFPSTTFLSTATISFWGMILPFTLLASACTSGASEPVSPSASLASQLDASGAAPPAENVQSPITQLERADVVETVDAGLGRFLGNFSTEPAFDRNEQFEGFRIVRIRNPELFRGLGLGRGDVVTRINEKPIESPPQAYEAFIGLKTAPSLDIDYLRGGRPMRLSLPIVGQAPAPTAAKTQISEKVQASDKTQASAKEPASEKNQSSEKIPSSGTPSPEKTTESKASSSTTSKK